MHFNLLICIKQRILYLYVFNVEITKKKLSKYEEKKKNINNRYVFVFEINLNTENINSTIKVRNNK